MAHVTTAFWVACAGWGWINLLSFFAEYICISWPSSLVSPWISIYAPMSLHRMVSSRTTNGADEDAWGIARA